MSADDPYENFEFETALPEGLTTPSLPGKAATEVRNSDAFREWMQRIVGQEDDVIPTVQLKVGDQEFVLRNVRVSHEYSPRADGVEEAEILFTFEDEA